MLCRCIREDETLSNKPHVFPVKPAGQLQVKLPPAIGVHVPPFRHLPSQISCSKSIIMYVKFQK